MACGGGDVAISGRGGRAGGMGAVAIWGAVLGFERLYRKNPPATAPAMRMPAAGKSQGARFPLVGIGGRVFFSWEER